jgi:hypothetical protein
MDGPLTACGRVYWVVVLLALYVLRPVSSRVFATKMSPNVIETQYGRLRGVLVALPNRSLPPVEAYFGIQYASLLGGELRFMPPTSTMEKWDNIRVALKFRSVCPQRLPDMERLQREVPLERVEHFKRLLPYLEKQHEECLNLNVYVPVRGRSWWLNTHRDSSDRRIWTQIVKRCTRTIVRSFHRSKIPGFQAMQCSALYISVLVPRLSK